MYCLLEIQSSSMKKPRWIEKNQYDVAVETLNNASDLLDAIELFSFFAESYEELRDWCEHTDTNAEYLMRNKHMAERKCRGLLLELKTYFLQMKSKLGRKYGEDSRIYKTFTDAEEDGKRNDTAFAFAMDLKECANHCNAIVHSFFAADKKGHLQPCCDPSVLLSEFGSWTKKNRKYLASLRNNIDLLEVFESVYGALKKIQLQLIGHFLGTAHLKDRLLELRAFMDDCFTKENCISFHLAHMVYQNKKDAPKWAFYQKKAPVTFDAHPIDWIVLYELTDLLKESEGEQ